MVTQAKSDADLPEAMAKVGEELDALNSLVTVIVVVFILLVILQIINTILKVMRPKHKKNERECKPHAVVVHSGSSRGSKKESRTRKDSGSRRCSLPSKRLCTNLTLSTESECEKSSTKSSKEVCTGSREECLTPGGGHPSAFKRPSSSSSVPALEMSKEMAASLKMLNCADVVSTPLPSTAPLAVPHTPSKSKSTSKESIEDSAKEKKKDSPPKTAPTQPNSAPQVAPITPVKAPADTNQVAPNPATPAAALTTATIASPGVQSTQRLSVVESLTTGPKKNSPVKTAKEEAKDAPPAAPAPATAPPQ